MLSLTFNGKFGVFEWSDELKKFRGDMEGLIVQIKSLPDVCKLWADFRQWLTDNLEAFPIGTWATSMELSPKSLENDEHFRIHFHVFLAQSNQGHGVNGQLHKERMAELNFTNYRPFLQILNGNRKFRDKGDATKNAALARSCYYLQMPKIGSLFTAGSHQPHKDYRIPPDHIQLYFAQGKMGLTEAQLELAYCCNNVSARQQNLVFAHRYIEEHKKNEEVKANLAAIRANRRPGIDIEVVSKQWIPHMQIPADRHKALVLVGPSMVGKTTFCKQLVAHDEYMEINCMNLKTQPNLARLSHKTKLICFDEASVRWCLDNKKMLQGPEAPLTMGDSATGMHSYSVQLNGMKMVICSNTWHEELTTGFGEADLTYLKKNFIVVDCKDQLWQGPPWLQEDGSLIY